MEDSVEKISSLKTSLESAYKEIAELKRGLVEKEGEAQELALSKEMAAKQALQEQLRELQEQVRNRIAVQQSLYLMFTSLGWSGFFSKPSNIVHCIVNCSSFPSKLHRLVDLVLVTYIIFVG